MPRATLSATGIILARGTTAGGYEKLSLLSGENGLVRIMRRQSASQKNVTLPDIFDLCSVSLEGKQGGAWFLQEYTALRRFAGLGAHYPALEAASLWARLMLANAGDVESAAGLFNITLKALDAWDKGAEPSAVRLKALYLFARDEGLPAREEWLSGLPEARRNVAELALRTPLDAIQTDADNCAEVMALADSLTRWLCESQYIIPPRDAGEQG